LAPQIPSTPIAPHIAGFVAEIAVTDNQLVHAGQLLIRLDDRDVRAAADHAEAILLQRTGALASLRARSTLQQSTIEQAVADLDAKRARAEFAHQDAETLAGPQVAASPTRCLLARSARSLLTRRPPTDVCDWHKRDIRPVPSNVGFRGISEHVEFMSTRSSQVAAEQKTSQRATARYPQRSCFAGGWRFLQLLWRRR